MLLSFWTSHWRRVQKQKLVNLFNTDETFYSCIHLCSTLPLVPLEEIDTARYYILPLWQTGSEDANDLKIYIENTWLNNETSSLFCRNTWNHYGTLRVRTNNSAEGFHNKLNSMVNKNNASFGEIGSILKKIQVHNTSELARIVSGGLPKKIKRDYIRQDQKINTIWTNF
ncbi:hypothetical protein DMUE_0488 [Dictyocoela muelleri]|nr:hypothetical protein DMUE_0488 [Dictyocoela muelleri]